ncbi:MAG: hypothetical protein OEY18_06415 [Candidatus Aminicenantes bacterium]|jgi:SSS family solute:Na+ symporter|nr:hypothetical protein [Candidatus Aminicenantes bacterium]MDH5384326.1 hypothetical protein [Candidatus Aminicenantes bacterium]MDH5744881.1 hypothetical protein [Candidatus Aminicenantes bacterium]
MNLNTFDLLLISGYLILVALIGFWIKKKATKKLEAYYLAGRNVPWWMLGLSGCSSSVDIVGSKGMIR